VQRLRSYPSAADATCIVGEELDRSVLFLLLFSKSTPPPAGVLVFESLARGDSIVLIMTKMDYLLSL
jgi:hypothetical protein